MDRSLSDVPSSSSTHFSSEAPKSNPGIANLVPPVVIGVAGNEEFLDRIAALFVRQVLASRETELNQKQSADKICDSTLPLDPDTVRTHSNVSIF
jgi:hypothetical protein